MEDVTLAEFLQNPEKYRVDDEEDGKPPYRVAVVDPGGVVSPFNDSKKFGTNTFHTIEEARETWHSFQLPPPDEKTRPWDREWRFGGSYYDRNRVVIIDRNYEIVAVLHTGDKWGGKKTPPAEDIPF